MKKKNFIFLIITLVLLVVLITSFNYFKTTNTYVEDNINNRTKIIKGISMNLEQTAGAGDYKTVTQSGWPTEGYKFNTELSRCENGSTLSWDDTKKAVIVSGNLSDKCYVYFDIYQPTLAEYIISQYTGNQGVNNLYYHDSTLANGAGDNSYRYAGASDSVNNYICLGSEEATCPDANLFRIIGVFGDQTKVISSSPVTGRAWDTNGSNTWSTSSLNTYLNGTYLTRLGSLSNKIAITTWKVGGNTYTNIGTKTPSVAYQNEIVNPAESSTYDAKIGLIYVSDYYYGASSSAWTLMGYNDDATKDYRAAHTINWIWLGRGDTWTITRSSDNLDCALAFGSNDGIVSVHGVLDDDLAVSPVFFLNPSVTYASGSGTSSDPIRIN